MKKDIVSKYKVKIELHEGLWRVAKECRESYYYLRSIEEWLSQIVITDKNDVEKLDGIRKYINSDIKEFKKLDEELLEGIGKNSKSNKEDVSKSESKLNDENTQSDLINLEYTDILNYIIKFVELRERIDKIQSDSIVFLIAIRNKVNNSIVREHEKLNNILLQYQQEIMAYMAFNHSHNEDKIVIPI